MSWRSRKELPSFDWSPRRKLTTWLPSLASLRSDPVRELHWLSLGGAWHSLSKDGATVESSVPNRKSWSLLPLAFAGSNVKIRRRLALALVTSCPSATHCLFGLTVPLVKSICCANTLPDPVLVSSVAPK